MSVRKSLFLSFAQRNGTLLIQFMSSLLIARLLTPHEIGIFSIGSVIVAFSHVVRYFGVANYIVQEKDLTRDRLRSAQAIVWIASLSIATVLAVFADWAGRFYAEPGVTLTMQVLALNFVIIPFGSVTMALLVRNMDFAKTLQINLACCVVQNATAIGLAWSGVGFISLAWGAVASTLLSSVVLLWFRFPGQSWLPGLREWRHVFSAGFKLSSSTFLYDIGQGGPELICGRTLGFEAVAFFSRGFGAASMLLRALVDGIVPVANAYYAKKAREDASIREPYLTAISYLAVVALPAFAMLVLLAEPLILVLYGAQWASAAPPMQIMALGFGCIALANISGAVLVGSGQIGTNLRMNVIFQPLKVAMVFAVSSWGLSWVAWAVALADVALATYSIAKANEVAGASWGDLTLGLLPAVYVAAGTALVSFGMLSLIGSAQPTVNLLVGGATAMVTWGALLFALRHPLAGELRALRRSRA